MDGLVGARWCWVDAIYLSTLSTLQIDRLVYPGAVRSEREGIDDDDDAAADWL